MSALGRSELHPSRIHTLHLLSILNTQVARFIRFRKRYGVAGNSVIRLP